jgi:hypothetical protein
LSFPANFNIRYYKGDLYQFVIRPKTSAGDPFPISDSTHQAFFYASTSRGGSSENTFTLSATIVAGNVVATILSSDVSKFNQGNNYFYDVSVQKISDPNEVYTLLTGSLTITPDITEPTE